MPTSGAPAGVNMPKKRDPRLRGVQQPQEKQFFDSADYEVKRQQQQQQSQQPPQKNRTPPLCSPPS
ncbi:hypothetical protein C3747_121g214c [Trypanosoma cruzi]|uniref:Uncharacterized protein n=2 Tax=Trypanosoma cruzi TaxID=5693 RepID=Q4CT31_TRYCC|nr:hypothetical protein, conserved [Trypanosoma cruzi]EAN83433.1 hypothetical protein, conserved [Trypanosoma cruzi]KAF8301883.1 hypothetical protein TcYC6_0052010 [Trypanosoma cruzi]PWV06026.1 hypothetical protein C3747_121g214c [Trypanosoma cruzi]|eukprot:XP_805284.1 hypothetical protein [Trypanosoma cruzi strain CL Brener]